MHERIKAERERLGYGRKAFADLINAHVNSQSNWENGHRYPDARVLSLWAKHGVDISYVLTGQRTIPVSESLTTSELALVESYRRAQPAQRKIIEAVANLAAESVSQKLETPYELSYGHAL